MPLYIFLIRSENLHTLKFSVLMLGKFWLCRVCALIRDRLLCFGRTY